MSWFAWSQASKTSLADAQRDTQISVVQDSRPRKRQRTEELDEDYDLDERVVSRHTAERDPDTIDIQAQLSQLQKQQEELLALIRHQNNRINDLQDSIGYQQNSGQPENSPAQRRSASIAVKSEERNSPYTDLYDATPRPQVARNLQRQRQRRQHNLPISPRRRELHLPDENSKSQSSEDEGDSAAELQDDVSHDVTPVESILFATNARYPPVTQETITLYDGMRTPAAVEMLAPLHDLRLPRQPNEEFSHGFIRKVLGGTLFGNGWWEVAKPARTGKKRVKRLFPNIRVYVLLSAEHQPLLPRYPGHHGAQISAVLQNATEEAQQFPLFIRHGSGGYRYFGTYIEPRYSDRIGIDEMIREVPDHVKLYWAEELGAKPPNGKKRKIITAIKDAWPKVPLGWWDETSESLRGYEPHLEMEYGEPLKKPITDEEAEEVTTSDVLEAFTKPDADCADPALPSTRLFYEYLQAVGYDHDFYQKLVEKKSEMEASATI